MDTWKRTKYTKRWTDWAPKKDKKGTWGMVQKDKIDKMTNMYKRFLGI